MVRSRETPVRAQAGSVPRPRQRYGGLSTLALLGLSLSAVGVMNGCSSDGLTPGKEVASSELYWALELNHKAVALAAPGKAPYDTLTLVATPRTVDGAPLGGLPAATYVSTDPEKVAVTSDGVLRAIATTAPGEVVPVVATLTAGNLKHIDTALVAVLDVDPLPVLASLSIHPTPPDSAKVGAADFGSGGTLTCFALPMWTETPFTCQVLLPVSVLDANGAPIAGVPVAFKSSDKGIAWVDDGGRVRVGPHLPGGEVNFIAGTTILGVAKADTLPFRTGWPVLSSTRVSRTSLFEYPVIKVGTGAVVLWHSEEPIAIDVNFADPTNVAKIDPAPFLPFFTLFLYCHFRYTICDDAGNFVLSPADTASNNEALSDIYAGRRFPVPGTYEYSSTALGAGGRVIVVDER